MIKAFRKAFRFYLDIYSSPGGGVAICSAPDSMIDIFRMQGVRLPLTDQPAKPRAAKRRASIWGGQGATRIVSYRTTQPCTPKAADC